MTVVFFDVETSGLDPHRHEIIQIAGIAVGDAWEELETFEAKVHFDPKRADAKALEMNSFSADVWNREAIHQKPAMTIFDEFLMRHADIDIATGRGASRVAQLAGHNISKFDMPFLQATFKRHYLFLHASYSGLDTYQLAIWWRHGTGVPITNLKLTTLSEYFGIEHESAHDALGDVRANVAVARRLVEECFGAKGVDA